MSREVVCVKVLDLDETLVHCSVEPIVGADLTFPVEFNGVNYTVYVRKRPHLHRFLEAIHDKFEVVVFTASQKVYADRLLNLLDPEGKYFR
jgi:CTD small phosphatase-like protein 2